MVKRKPIKRTFVLAGIFGLLFCFYGGIGLFWLGGDYNRGLEQEQMNGFKRAYFLPRGEVMRFEESGSDRFCRIHVSDNVELRQFMDSRNFNVPWKQGNFTKGATNTVKSLAEEFHLLKEELPDLGHQELKWQVGRNSKLLEEPLPYEYFCIVDEQTMTVWIMGVGH